YFNFIAKRTPFTSWTPPGFSRWYFNFIAKRTPFTSWTPPGFSRWYFNFIAKTESVRFDNTKRSCEIEEPPAKAWWCRSYSAARFVVVKLKNHRLKPGGVGHIRRLDS